ncbi:hypothetical protein BJ741DRAFT_629895 [Chytriomyces cf. hyalinus JEL632]|nr:hypothetical protein BJ741DRAFT_629895 [Chytriomyces cf. hyalinus JEL632]
MDLRIDETDRVAMVGVGVCRGVTAAGVTFGVDSAAVAATGGMYGIGVGSATTAVTGVAATTAVGVATSAAGGVMIGRGVGEACASAGVTPGRVPRRLIAGYFVENVAKEDGAIYVRA